MKESGLAAPAYHRPQGYWRARHMNLLGAQASLESPRYQLEECWFCHEPQRSCNPCHAYVGVAAVEAGEAGR